MEPDRCSEFPRYYHDIIMIISNKESVIFEEKFECLRMTNLIDDFVCGII